MKRAREQNESAAGGQQGETAHHDTTAASPDRKKSRRAGRAEDYDDKEGGLEWNLLRDLPYVAFRHLLDFLSSSPVVTANAEGSLKASGLPGVPELCRVRAESQRFVGELEWGEDVAPGEEEAFELRMEAQEKQLRALRPYHAPPRHRDSMGSVAALRLTCHAIKNAVDHALGTSAQASALYAPLDQFLIDHFFPATATAASSAGGGEAVLPLLPLLSDSAEAARTKERFRKMADLTLGVAQARLHQSRLDEVLEYVWRSWEFAPAKLDALRQQLLAPRATVAGDQAQAAPLLKVEYLRREDDYLGRSYGLGIRACLSLGLPDMPHERAEVGLWVLQAWDHRDEGWDLQVFVDLRTSSASWKHHLKSSRQDQHDEAKEEEKDEQEEEKEEEEEEGGKVDEASAPLHVVIFDSYRSRGEIIDQTTANFTLLRKLWQCVGLGDGGGGDEEGGEEDHSWKGKEVLTTLLACLGFAWHDDVDLLWDDCDDEDADAVNEHVAGIGRDRRRMIEAQNTLLLETSRLKHKELLQGLAPYAAQLNAFLDARQQSAATETREQVVRHVRRFIGQQRLARTESYIRQRLQGGAPWPSSEFALAHVEGHQVAKQLRVVYARRFDLAPGEYSSFSDHTVEFAFPVSADALRRVGLAADDDDDGGNDDHHHHRAGPLPLEVVVQMSIKSADGYTGAHEHSMVTARVVGHHPRLRAALAAKAVAVPNTALGLEGGGKAKQPDDAMAEEEPERQEATEGVEEGDKDDDDEVVLKLDCTISDMSRSEKVMATEATELVGRLLGLSLRPTTSTSDAPQATTDPDSAGEPQPRSRGHNPDPAMETTPFARAVLAFLHEAVQVATWDAEEGSFPVQSALRHKWEAKEYNDDGETGAEEEEEEDTNTAEQLKSQLTQEISDLCEMELVMSDW